MKLMFDIPKEYSDMNRSELSQLYMKLKGVLEQIEREFENINGDNLNAEYREKLENAITNAEAYQKEAESRKQRVFKVQLPESTSSVRRVDTDIVTDKSLVSIFPQSDTGEALWVSKVYNGGFNVSGGVGAVEIVVLVHEEVIP